MGLNTMITFVFKSISLKLLILLLVIYLSFPLYFLPAILGNSSLVPLDLMLFYTAEQAYTILDSYGEELRQRYVIGLLTADLAYPLYYGFLLSSLFVYFLKKQGMSIQEVIKKRSLILIPYVITSTDLLENSLNIIVTLSYPERLFELASLAGAVTALKWFLTLIVILLLLTQMYKAVNQT